MRLRSLCSSPPPLSSPWDPRTIVEPFPRAKAFPLPCKGSNLIIIYRAGLHRESAVFARVCAVCACVCKVWFSMFVVQQVTFWWAAKMLTWGSLLSYVIKKDPFDFSYFLLTGKDQPASSVGGRWSRGGAAGIFSPTGIWIFPPMKCTCMCRN